MQYWNRVGGQKDPVKGFQALCAAAAVLYPLFGLILQNVAGAEDPISLIHRMGFAAAYGLLTVLPFVSERIKKVYPVLVYALAAVSVLHMGWFGGTDMMDPGVLVAMLLIVPVMNLALFRYDALLPANVILLLMAMVGFAASNQTPADTLRFGAAAAALGGISYLAARRVRFVEEQSHAHERRFWDLFRHSLDGVAVCELLADQEGRTVDFVFREANPSLFQETGLRAELVVGRRASDVLPGIENTPFMEIYRQVVETGQPLRFEQYHDCLDRHLNMAVHPMGGRQFAVVFEDISERVQAQESTKDREAKFRALFEHCPDGVFIVDDADTIVDCNQEAAAMNGYAREELIGAPIWQLNPAETADSITYDLEGKAIASDAYYDYLRTHGRIQFRTSHRRKDGSKFPVEVAAVLVNLGGREYTIGFDRDITQREQVEKTLRDQQQLFHGVLESIQDGISVLGSDLTIRHTNETIARWHGGTSLAGRKCYEAYHGKTEPCQDCPTLRCLASGSSERSEVAVHTAEGLKWLEINSYPFHEQEDSPPGAIEFVRDVTGRRAMERALEESEEQLRLMTRNLKDVIMETDQAGRLTYVSPSHRQVLGRGSELQGQSWFDYVCEEDRVHAERMFAEALDGGEEARQEYRYWHPARGIIWLESIATTYRNAQDERVVLLTSRDITERKHAEEAIRRQAQRQELAAKLAFDFLNESPDNIDDRISQSLDMVGEVMGADQCQIIVFADDRQSLVTTHHWTAPHLADYLPPQLQKAERVPWLVAEISSQRTVSIASKDDLPSDADGERTFLDDKGAEAMLCVPIMIGGVVTGFLGIGFARAQERISDDDALTLQIAAGVIASAMERGRAERALTHLTFHDQVTGLYNRTFFEQEIERLDVPAQLPLTIVMVDVNGLKTVNDALGHQRGDELLMNVAGILKASCRWEDVVARWGGDEFVIVLPRTHAATAEEVCRRIAEACSSAPEKPIPLSVALGYAVKTHPDEDVQGILKRAEDCMYTDKMNSAQSSRSSLIASLQRTLEEHSHETREHAQTLENLCQQLGRRLGLSASELAELSLFSLLHDLGKVAIPEHVLEKPETLTHDEWEIMKRHPEIGYRIASTSPELASVAEYILSHHERWDGCGYPRGLAGRDIPLPARILSVADAYDAMTRDRPYHTGISHEEALNEIGRCAGFQFDPEVVNAFLELWEERSRTQPAAE